MRMFEHPNAALVERLYAAFDSKDAVSLGKLIAEDAVWHVPGTSPISGDHRGQAAIFAYFQKLAELTDGTFHAELIDVLASDMHAAALAAAIFFQAEGGIRDVAVTGVQTCALPI